MRIASFTMARNEASIIGPFSDQLNALVDVPVLLDHGSTDGTDRLFLEQVEMGRLYRLESTGYPQAEVANFFTHLLFEEFGVDYLFFLDCDEFLPFESRDELLASLPEQGYGELRWRNCHFEEPDLEVPFHGRISCLRQLSAYPKVSFSRGFLERNPNLTVTQGYHSLIGLAAPKTPVSLSSTGLLHFPVPFREKYIAKILASSERIRKNEYLSANNLGTHWVSHADSIHDEVLHAEKLREIALNYPDKSSLYRKDITSLEFRFGYVRQGFSADRLKDSADGFTEGRKYNQDFRILDREWKLLFEKVAEERSVTAAIPRNDDTNGPRTMLHKPDYDLDYEDIQDRWISPLFSLPRKLPLTAWHGHIPFLFALFRNARPGCFVELGVHYGASLIAAATAAQAYDVKTRIVGVDTWAGDDHAGHYGGDEIHRELASFVGRSFADVTLMRTTFDEARETFADGSIDMLHIDGLHTYEAVRHDFETWLPKTSDRAVVLFHDTAVRDRGFGVWRFWEEVSRAYPSLEFSHCHGLGVLFTGTQSLGDAFLRQLCEDAGLFGGYRSTISQIAEILPLRSAYLTTEEPPAEPAAPASAGGADPEIEALRAELRNTQWALQHYKNQYQSLSHHYESSTSWRVTRPLRYVKRLIG